ncbi:ATP-binding protein [Chitinibacter sp. SCUT-21]|uniref:ATP-binding protein n=1 Tax=Chitinibacter sp. SCUT-21 TaxID=2970891 RepID=UPI0035A6C187
MVITQITETQLIAQLKQIAEVWHLEPERARLACLELIEHARQLRLPYYQICAAELYGQIMDHEGKAFEARNVLYEAVQQAQALHNFQLEARIYEQIARLHYSKGDYRTALQDWLTCIELANDDPKTWMLAKVGVGQVYDALDDAASAILFHQAAASRITEVDDPYLEAKIQINLAVNLHRCQRNDEARVALDRALHICLAQHFPDYAAESYYRLAEIDIDDGHLDQAMDLLQKGQTLASQVGYQWGLANILSAMAVIHAQRKDWSTALEVIHAGQIISRANNFSHILMRQHLAAAQYAEALFDSHLALQELKAGFASQQQIHASAQPEKRSELEQKTGLRLSVGTLLINLANHPAIEHGKLVEFAPVISKAASEILNVQRAGLWQLNEDRLDPVSIYDQKQDQFITAISIEQQQAPVFFNAMNRGKTLIAHDALHHPEAWDLAERYLRPTHTSSILALPAFSNNYRCLLIFEHIGEQRNWIPDEIQSASQIAEITIRAMTNQERREFQREIHDLNVRLMQANEELEQRVQERTQQLAKSNQDLHKAMDQLVQSEKLAALGSLVAGIAHELNTPLGAALTCSSTLSAQSQEIQQKLANSTLKKSALDEFIDNNLSATQLIERNIQRASDLVANFKQVAIDTDSTRRREFDLSETIDEVLTMLQLQLERTPYQFENGVPKGIIFDSFPGPLEQIISNLILNSVTHGFENRSYGKVTLYSEPVNSQWQRLIFEDNGCGMSPEIQKRVFDPFFTTKLGKGGSGLGLYITYNIVCNILGGELELESELGRFTRFIITLPRQAPLNNNVSS